MSADKTTKRYPEVAEAGSLKEAILQQFSAVGSPLAATAPTREEFPVAYARVEQGPRFSQIYLAAEERLFMPDYWDNGVCLAHGKSPDFSAIVTSVEQWVSGSAKSISELAKVFSFVALNDGAGAHEDGTETEAQWHGYLEGHRVSELHPDLPELVEAVSKQPKLRRLFPYTSMATFHFSRCTGYPFTRDTPWFQPIGDRRFRVLGALGRGQPGLGEGTAQEVAQIAADELPDDIPEAWVGTAET